MMGALINPAKVYKGRSLLVQRAGFVIYEYSIPPVSQATKPVHRQLDSVPVQTSSLMLPKP